MKEEKKYFLYARRTTESDDQQDVSIDDQIDRLKKDIDENGVRIVAVFQEVRNETTPGRKVFHDMLDKIEAGEADGFICWSPESSSL